jgi:chromosome segregation ATPase
LENLAHPIVIPSPTPLPDRELDLNSRVGTISPAFQANCTEGVDALMGTFQRSNSLQIEKLCESFKDIQRKDQQTLLTELEAERQRGIKLKEELNSLQTRHEKLQDTLTHTIKTLAEEKARSLLSQEELTGEIASLRRQNDEMKAEVAEVERDRDAIKEFLKPLAEYLNS